MSSGGGQWLHIYEYWSGFRSIGLAILLPVCLITGTTSRIMSTFVIDLAPPVAAVLTGVVWHGVAFTGEICHLLHGIESLTHILRARSRHSIVVVAIWTGRSRSNTGGVSMWTLLISGEAKPRKIVRVAVIISVEAIQLLGTLLIIGGWRSAAAVAEANYKAVGDFHLLEAHGYSL